MPLDPERLTELATVVLGSWGGAGAVLTAVQKRLRKIINMAVKTQNAPLEARIAALERYVFKGQQRTKVPPPLEADEDDPD
jgi:hypothetical protein